MSASNWVSNRDMSPDRNNRYHVDNVALQLRLGLPIELIGIGITSQGLGSSHFREQRGFHMWQSHKNNGQKESNSNEIMQTVDGIPIRKVYITNIASEVERREMISIFGRFGTVMNIYLGVSKNDSHKKFAFITFEDPKVATRVLSLRKFQDMRHRNMYVAPADSWHQPKEDADGNINWNPRVNTKKEEESEEDEDQSLPVEEISETVEINKESLNVLNDDCLLHVFSFLSLHEVAKFEIVCKRWQGLSYRMWRCLRKLSFSEQTLPKMKANTSTLAAYLQRCGSSLLELDLTAKKHEFDETTLAVVAKNCNNLEVLRVSNLDAGNRSLAHLGRSCPKLKQLYMSDCDKFNDNDLMSFLPKCHQLSVLDISCNGNVTGKFLAQVQSPLASLHLSYLPIEGNALVAGLQRLSGSLETLTINGCANVPIGQIEKVLSAVPNLTSLTLCRLLTGLRFDDKPLLHIGKLKKLNSINLSMNNAICDRLVAAIVEGCEELTEMNVSGSGGGNELLTEQGLSMISRLRHLTHLNISYLENTTDLVLKNITARNTKLKKLICNGCPELNDEGCIHVVTVCNDLELFDLSGCPSVSEQTVSAALVSVKMRTNNVPLRLVVGGTSVAEAANDPDVPLLTIDLQDFSEEHLRPDFMDEMFFPPSDSDGEEDLDHLCERLGCDCDFDFDDLYDPTLCNDFVDDAIIRYDNGDDDDDEPVYLNDVYPMSKENNEDNFDEVWDL